MRPEYAGSCHSGCPVYGPLPLFEQSLDWRHLMRRIWPRTVDPNLLVAMNNPISYGERGFVIGGSKIRQGRHSQQTPHTSGWMSRSTQNGSMVCPIP